MRVIKSFTHCEDGNVGILFGLSVFMLAGLVFGALDYGAAVSAKTALQARLDAAALGAARSTAATDAELQVVGDRYMRLSAVTVPGEIVTVSFKAINNGEGVSATAQGYVRTSILGYFNSDKIVFDAQSKVMRATKNIEVALVLDTTGSMAGTRIADLKVAANDLIELVVKDVQQPFYSKVAVVPYSVAVNVGSYAALLRGVTIPGTCTTPGCDAYKFKNPSNKNVTNDISNCVTERTGANAYTDVSPSVSPLGRNYHSPNNPCNLSPVTPLSSNKTVLSSAVNALKAGGSTGGQIGVAWGWYMVSPNFGSLWPTASQPGQRNDSKLLKAVVLMTDGEYNSTYCNGVISKDSTSGSGSPDDHIDCNATNGNSYTQTMTLCQNMKNAGVTVYTVGLEVVNTQQARDLVNKCASSAANVYIASSSKDLKSAFRSIGQDIAQLHISQ
jgi:Flp pilus assembly protein TadG